MPATYTVPRGGASLILSFKLQSKAILIIGSGVLAASRVFAALEADSSVFIIANGGLESMCDELKWRVQQQQVQFVDWDDLPNASAHVDEADRLEAFLQKHPTIALASITDTLSSYRGRNHASAEAIYRVLRARNILVNTTDMTDLCDFSFTSSHRFENPETGEKTALQLGVTTNGQGCRMAARLRREIVAKLPRDVGKAVERVAHMRLAAKRHEPENESVEHIDEEDACEDTDVVTPNRPVPSRSHSDLESFTEARRRRIKWVAQVSEYWPISKLASMSDNDAENILADSYTSSLNIPADLDHASQTQLSSLHFHSFPKKGRILLVGSGPGHPSLLTIATHTALTQLADLVLSDKLVPEEVLSLIPKHVEVRIAKKFPGNAEGAQIEMMEAAIGAAKQGLTVVRLKQGDPVVYGRAGEEVLYFRSHGFEPLVIPGVSSALAAPTFAGIPVTQRGAAESLIVCTGVGRKGKEVQLPGYRRPQTVVILMGVARIQQVIDTLVDCSDANYRRDGQPYPLNTPIAIIERASMPDQRVISSTLSDIVEALESNGEQRPPGMMIVGWAVLSLHGEGDMGILDEGGENQDEARVRRWLGGDRWKVHEGLDAGWESF